MTMANNVKVTLKILQYGILPGNTYITGEQDIDPCHFVKTSTHEDIDLAIIKTNKPPTFQINAVDLNRAIVDNKDIAVESFVYTIGFPGGIKFTHTKEGIQPVSADGKISQLGDEYEFMFDANVWHGASGSPVFNNRGRLIGIAYAGHDETQGYNLAIKAKHAVELAR